MALPKEVLEAFSDEAAPGTGDEDLTTPEGRQAALDKINGATGNPVPKKGPKTVEPGAYLTEHAKEGFRSGSKFARHAVPGYHLPFVREIMDKFLDSSLDAVLPVDQETLEGTPRDVNSVVSSTAVRAVAPAVSAIANPLSYIGAPIAGAGKNLLQQGVKGLPALLRPVIAAGAMGETAELGGKAGEAVGEFAGGDAGRAAGNAVGSVAGGVLGGSLASIRSDAVGAGATVGASMVGTAKDAFKTALEAQKAGDKRNLLSIFYDNMGAVKSVAQGYQDRRVLDRFTDIARKDPEARPAIEEYEAITKRIGDERMDSLFSLGQKTKSPTIVRMERERPVTVEEDIARTARDTQLNETMVKLYRDRVDTPLPVGRRAVADSFEDYRKRTVNALALAEESQKRLSKQIPNLLPHQETAAGKALRTEIDTATKAAEAAKNKQFSDAIAKFDTETGGMDVTKPFEAAKGLAKSTLAQIKPGEVDAPTLRRLMNTLEGSADEAAEGAPKILDAAGKAPAPRTLEKMKLADLDPYINSLYADIQAARNAGDFNRANALTKVRKAFQDATENTAAGSDYAKAKADYRDKFVPTYKTGFGESARTEMRSGKNVNQETIPDENLLTTITDPKRQSENAAVFARMFGGGNGQPRNAAAYKAVGEKISSNFQREVLAKKNFGDDDVSLFLSENAPFLRQMPKTREALEATAARMVQYRSAGENALARYKNTLENNPISKVIGPEAAGDFMASFMSDPTKLRNLAGDPARGIKPSALFDTPEKTQQVLREVMESATPQMMNGNLDYAKLRNLMTAGAHNGKPGTLPMLAERAFGPEKGKQWMDDINDIVTLSERHSMVDPRTRRLADLADSPAKEATGQSVSQWLAMGRAMASGFATTYLPAVGAGRFVNQKMNQALSAAEEKVLYDPAMARAVATMMRTPANMPVEESVISKLLESHPELAGLVKKQLIDRKLLATSATAGAAVGASNATEENKNAKPKPKRETPSFAP